MKKSLSYNIVREAFSLRTLRLCVSPHFITEREIGRVECGTCRSSAMTTLPTMIIEKSPIAAFGSALRVIFAQVVKINFITELSD